MTKVFGFVRNALINTALTVAIIIAVTACITFALAAIDEMAIILSEAMSK